MTAVALRDGSRLHTTRLGAGPPLVCVPGGPGLSGGCFEDLAGLGARRTLVLADPRGTGRSELPEDPACLSMAQLAEDLEDVRASLGVARLDVLAHSAGTLVAQLWAARHPESVGSLVLVCPGRSFAGGGRTDLADLVARRSAEDWYPDARAALDALETCSPGQRSGLLREARPFLYRSWDERARAHAALCDRLTSARAAAGFAPPGLDTSDVLAGLRAVVGPVLVVAGALDALTGVAVAGDVASCFTSGRLVVLTGAAHTPWVDDPVAFRGLVGSFLDGRGATGATLRP